MLQWNNLFLAEIIFVTILLFVLGLVKLPRFLMRRKLKSGSPWGYYADHVPKADPGFCAENNENFLHNTATGFGGMQGFGECGEFSGFGELGEYGQGFSSGQE